MLRFYYPTTQPIIKKYHTKHTYTYTYGIAYVIRGTEHMVLFIIVTVFQHHAVLIKIIKEKNDIFIEQNNWNATFYFTMKTKRGFNIIKIVSTKAIVTPVTCILCEPLLLTSTYNFNTYNLIESCLLTNRLFYVRYVKPTG